MPGDAGKSAAADSQLLSGRNAEILHKYSLFKLNVVRRGREVVKLQIDEKTTFTAYVRLGIR
jgi:hypothetical protein